MRDGRLRAGIRLARTQVCGHESRGSAWDASCASWPGAQPPNQSFPTKTATSNWARGCLNCGQGEGGELRVVAPQEWCRDTTYVLEVRLTVRTPPTGQMPVARVAAGPSDCAWRFENVPAGLYEAVVLTPREERIVANGRALVSKGAATLLQVESAETEVEGWLTSHESLPSPLRLQFQLPYNRWTARVAADGSYHVTLGDVGERSSVAIWAEADGSPGSEPTSAMNVYLLKSATISRGVVRLDLDDVKLPPVVVHVEVPAIAGARFDEFAETMIDGQRAPGFKLLRGFRGQFLANYGDHTVQIWTNDRQHVLATTVVTVRPPETESRVVLEVPRR